MNKIEELIQKIELDYLSGTGTDEQNIKKLPIKEPEQIKALNWNLLTDEKYRSKISYKDYSDILEIWFKRISNIC